MTTETPTLYHGHISDITPTLVAVEIENGMRIQCLRTMKPTRSIGDAVQIAYDSDRWIIV